MRHADLNEDQINDLKRFEKLDKINMFITVANRSSGESFGELALINDTSRAATIQCLTNCYFATLDREDYNRILKKIELKQHHAQLQFVNQIPLLNQLSNNYISKLIVSFV